MKKILHKTGLVFGVFDGLHPGHHYFLKEAARQCHRLIVVVTLSEVVKTLKKRPPRYSLDERIDAIKQFDTRLTIAPGDRDLGTWEILRTWKPDIILLGHDQQGLGRALGEIQIPSIYLAAYHPEKYKSGLLNTPKGK